MKFKRTFPKIRLDAQKINKESLNNFYFVSFKKFKISFIKWDMIYKQINNDSLNNTYFIQKCYTKEKNKNKIKNLVYDTHFVLLTKFPMKFSKWDINTKNEIK